MKKLILPILLLLSMVPALAQRPALVPPVVRFSDSNGLPLAFGKLYSYQAGTTTPLATYTDSTSSTLNTNPVILDSTGSASVFVGPNFYKFVLQNSLGIVQWTADNISATGPCSWSTGATYALVCSGYTGSLAFGNAITAPSVNNIFYADNYCTTPATYDQSCLSNAINKAGNNSKVILSPHTYSFASKLTFTSLSSVTIEGSGAGSAIVMNGPSLECDSCTNLDIHGIAFNTATTPTVIVPSALPTANPATVIVIDRFSQGFGYIPSPNDLEVANYSAAQLAEAFDTGIIIKSGNRIHIWNNTMLYGSIFCYDTSNSRIDDNDIKGGGKANQWAEIGFFPSVMTGSTPTSFHNSIVHNHVSYSSFSGIIVSGGDDATIADNVTSYNGESGVKTNQISGTSTNTSFTHATITGNTSKYNYYDGFDLGSTYPHISTQTANSTFSGNVSSYNMGTGAYGDGHAWTFTANEVDNNQGPGFSLDFCDSVISNNVAANNGLSGPTSQNAAVDGAGAALTGCSGPANVVSGNRFIKGSTAQYALYSVGENFLINNVSADGIIFNATSSASDFNNNDSQGLHVFNPQAPMFVSQPFTSESATNVCGLGLGLVSAPAQYSMCWMPYLVATGEIGYKLQTVSVTGGINYPLTFDHAGHIQIDSGTNIIYRCTTAGSLPIGALTVLSSDCAASVATSLQLN